MKELEEGAWLDVASHLGMSLVEAKAKLSSSEFLLWLAYLKEKAQERTRAEWYAAQTALELRRIYCCLVGGNLPQLKDLLLEFSTEVAEQRTPEELTPEQRRERAMANARIWLGMFGIKP